MFSQFVLIQDKENPTKYHVEIDGKPIPSTRSVTIRVGVDRVPTVNIELIATSVVKTEADVEIKGDNA